MPSAAYRYETSRPSYAILLTHSPSAGSCKPRSIRVRASANIAVSHLSVKFIQVGGMMPVAGLISTQSRADSRLVLYAGKSVAQNASVSRRTGVDRGALGGKRDSRIRFSSASASRRSSCSLSIRATRLPSFKNYRATH